jgi:hypothetical protein
VVPLCTSVVALFFSASNETSNCARLSARVVVDSVETAWIDPATLASAVVAETRPQFTFSSTLRTFVAGSSNSSRISRSDPGLMVVMVPSK